MAQESFSLKVPRHGELSLEDVTAAHAAIEGGLWLSLSVIAELVGTEDLTWFEDIAEEAIRNAKSTEGFGMSMQIEARAVQYGVDVLTDLFNGYRSKLVAMGSATD